MSRSIYIFRIDSFRMYTTVLIIVVVALVMWITLPWKHEQHPKQLFLS